MADTPSTTETAIKNNAEGPKSVSVDGQSVTQHSISDQIEADRYARAQAAGRTKGVGIRRNLVRLPGGQT